MPRVTCQTSPHRPNDLEIIEENLASDFSDLAIGTGGELDTFEFTSKK